MSLEECIQIFVSVNKMFFPIRFICNQKIAPVAKTHLENVRTSLFTLLFIKEKNLKNPGPFNPGLFKKKNQNSKKITTFLLILQKIHHLKLFTLLGLLYFKGESSS